MTQKGVYYSEYTWDSNDQFNINATDGITGAATTEALWEADVTANLTALGTTAVDFINTITWSALSTGVSRFHTN